VILANLTMKTNSKIIFILTLLMVVGLLMPVISFATMSYGQDKREQVRENIKENIKEKQAEWRAEWQEIKDQHKQWQEEKQGIRENIASRSVEKKNNLICDNLEKWVVKIDQALTEREMKIEEKQIERLEKLNEKRGSRDQKLEQHRETWEEKWEEHFGMLEERASTSEQKQALVGFKEAVKEAIASRQAAVDGAISQFRTDLDKLIADRKTAIEATKTVYINAYNVAVQNAEQACVGGSDPLQIKEALRTALKAAKDKFNSDRRAIEKLDLKSLVEVRQQAFKEALEYFKKAMEEARADLRAVFNQ
jgi:hypothetical protein